MADKRKLILDVDVDVDSKPLRQLGNDAERAEDGFQDLNQGLKKLDKQYQDTTNRIGDLRREISRSGDLDLVKDLRKAENDLKRLGRDRKSIIGDLGPAGANAAEEFGVSFSQRIGPVLARAPMSGPGAIIGGALAAAALPYLGATISAGLLGAAGGAGILGGLTAASKDARVQGAAKGLATQVGDQLKKATGPEFINETLRSLDILRAGAREAQPDLERLVSTSSRFLAPLSEGAGKGAGSLLKGLADAAEGAEPVFRELGIGIAETGDAIGDFFHMISDDGASAGLALRDTFAFIGNTIRGTGAVVNGLTETYGKLRAGIALYTGDTATVVRYVDGEARAHQDAKAAAEAHAQAQSDFDRQIRNANIDLASQVGYLNEIRGANLSAAEANVAYRDAINEAKGAVEKKNVVTLDEEKALLRAVSAANSNVEALERTGATADETSGKFNSQRDSLIRLAGSMGMSRSEAQKYIDKLLQVPKNVNTTIDMTGIPTALGELAEVQRAINRLPSVKRTRFIVENQQITIRTDAGGKAAFSEGGPVRGPGPKGVDSVDARLAPGEYVLNNRTVDDLGGLAAVDRLVKGMGRNDGGAMVAAASASARTATTSTKVVNITVPVSAGYVANPLQVQQHILGVFEDLKRKGYI